MERNPGSDQIPLGEYIFRRIRQLGIQHVFGCPGDYNLNLLDHLDSIDDLEWVGTRNELNAAYAADGYGRAKGLPGVLVTTYGVGELSALNGIAGAYSEFVPIIHIVGMTSRSSQEQRLMLHHTLSENPDHHIYWQTSRLVHSASAILDVDDRFAEDCDRIIETSIQRRLPVYLGVPIDTPDILVDAGRLSIPLVQIISNPGHEHEEDDIVDQINSILGRAKNPCVLVDMLVRRFGLTEDVRELVEISRMPAFVTPLAKSVVDETSEFYAGVYVGARTQSRDVKNAIESSDAVIHLGCFPSDSNTGGWSYNLASQAIKVYMRPSSVEIGDRKWNSLSFVPVVKKLLASMKSATHDFDHEISGRLSEKRTLSPAANSSRTPQRGVCGPLKQEHIWNVFSSYLRPNDCIIAEAGTSQFGSLGMRLPSNCQHHTQLFYSSIGFTVGATLGMLATQKESSHIGRVILFVGDGSLQMTVQEISTMIHRGFHPTIVIIRNDGYTIERVIHGPQRLYNDIDPWRFDHLLPFFGASSSNSSFHSASTHEELQLILEDLSFQQNGNFQVLECMLDKYDSPRLLSDIVDASMAASASALVEADTRANRKRLKLDGTLTQSGLSTS